MSKVNELTIEERLGQEAYARRIAIERYRDDEFNRFVSRHGTYFKIHLLHPAVGAVLKALGLWGRGRRELLEPVVRENSVAIGPALPPEFDGFRILHLSDLHIDIEEALVESIARAVAPLRYDLCVMTGDYRSRTVGKWDKTMELMARLRPAFKGEVVCVLGNHDPIEMTPALESSGYRVLLNESLVLRRGGASLCFAGIDDPVIFETHDVGKALAEAPSGVVKVLLSHSPRVWKEAEAAGVSLLLAGHTHGGQICLPGGRMVKLNEPPPVRLHKGSWRVGNMMGYTSCGCGASGVACRLNCPSEVVLHTLSR